MIESDWYSVALIYCLIWLMQLALELSNLTCVRLETACIKNRTEQIGQLNSQ